MFGKRCTLCGGKLDSNGICKECGLDNKKMIRIIGSIRAAAMVSR